MPWVDASANVHDSRPNRIPSSIVLVCFRDSFLDIVGIDTESALARIGIDLYRVYVRLPRKRTLAVGITGLKKNRIRYMPGTPNSALARMKETYQARGLSLPSDNRLKYIPRQRKVSTSWPTCLLAGLNRYSTYNPSKFSRYCKHLPRSFGSFDCTGNSDPVREPERSIPSCVLR